MSMIRVVSVVHAQLNTNEHQLTKVVYHIDHRYR